MRPLLDDIRFRATVFAHTRRERREATIACRLIIDAAADMMITGAPRAVRGEVSINFCYAEFVYYLMRIIRCFSPISCRAMVLTM